MQELNKSTSSLNQRTAGRIAAQAHTAGEAANPAFQLGMANMYLTNYINNAAYETDHAWVAHKTIYELAKAQAGLISNVDLTVAVLVGLFGTDGKTGGVIYRFDISIGAMDVIRKALQSFLAYERVKTVYADFTPESILGAWDEGVFGKVLHDAASWYVGMVRVRADGERLPSDLEEAANKFFNDTKYIWNVLVSNPGTNGQTRAGAFWSSLLEFPNKFVVWGQNLYGLLAREFYEKNDGVVDPLSNPMINSVPANPAPINPTPEPIPQMTDQSNTIEVNHGPATHPLQYLSTKPDLIWEAFDRKLTEVTTVEPRATPSGIIDSLEYASKHTRTNTAVAARAIIDQLVKLRDMNPDLMNVITGLHVLQDYLVFHRYSHGTASTAEAAQLPSAIIQIARHLTETMPVEPGMKNVVIVLGSVLLRMANEILTPNSPASPLAIAEAMVAEKVPADIVQAINAAVANLVAIPDRFAPKTAEHAVSAAEAHRNHTPVGAEFFQQELSKTKAPVVAGLGEIGGQKPSAGGEYSRIMKDNWKQAALLLGAFSSVIEQKPYLAATSNGTGFVLEALSTVASLDIAQHATEDSVARAIVACVMDEIVDINMPVHPNYQPFLATPVAILVAYINMNRYRNHDCVSNVDGAALYTELASVVRFIGQAYQADEQPALLRDVFAKQKDGLAAKPYFSEISRQLAVNLAVVTTASVYNHAQTVWDEVFTAPKEPETTAVDKDAIKNARAENFDDVVLRHAGPVLERMADENQPRLVSPPELDAEGNLTNPGVVRDFRVMSEAGRRRFLEQLDLGQKAALVLAMIGDSVDPLKADDEFIARAMLNRWKAEPSTVGAAAEVTVTTTPVAGETAGMTFTTTATMGALTATTDPLAPGALNIEADVSADGMQLNKAALSGVAFKPFDPVALEQAGREVFASSVYGKDTVFASADQVNVGSYGLNPIVETVDVVAVLKIDMADTTKEVDREILPASMPGVTWTPQPVDFLRIEQWAQSALRQIDGQERDTLYGQSCNAILKDPTGTDRHVIATANRVNDQVTVTVKLVSTDEFLRNDFPLLANDQKVQEPDRQTLPGEVPSDLVAMDPLKASMPGEPPQVAPSGDVLVSKGDQDDLLVGSYAIQLGEGVIGSAILPEFTQNGWTMGTSMADHQPVIDWANAVFTLNPALDDAYEDFVLHVKQSMIKVPVRATASRSKGDTVIHIAVAQIDAVPLGDVPEVSADRVGQLRDALLAQAGLADAGRLPNLANRAREIRDAVAAQPAPGLADFAEELMHYLLDWVYKDRDAQGPKITRELMRGIAEHNRGVLAHLVPEHNLRTLEWSVDTALTHSTYDSITNAVNFAMSRVLGDKYVIGQVDWLCEYFRAGVAARSMEVARDKRAADKAE